MAIFISDRTKNITRNKEGHYTMTKGSIHQDMIILNVYLPNSRATKYNNLKVKELKEEIDNSTIIKISTVLSVNLEQVDKKICENYEHYQTT